MDVLWIELERFMYFEIDLERFHQYIFQWSCMMISKFLLLTFELDSVLV